MPVTSPRSGGRQFPATPLYWENTPEHRRKLAEAVRDIREGKLNATGTITLQASSTTTTLSDRRIGPDSVILMMPTTSNAGTAAWAVTSRGKQTATITHANNAQLDRIFAYAVIG